MMDSIITHLLIAILPEDEFAPVASTTHKDYILLNFNACSLDALCDFTF